MEYDKDTNMNFTEEELNKLDALLLEEEREITLFQYKDRPGAWANAIIYDANDKYIYVEFNYGVVGEEEHSENLKIDRPSMAWAD